MKTNTVFRMSIFGILIALNTLLSCEQKPSVDYVLISGNIANSSSTFVTVKNEGFSMDIDRNEDGSFSDTLRVDRGYYLFYNGRERTAIFLDKGYVLNLSIDQEQFDETLKFEGEGMGTDVNNYQANMARLAEETGDFEALHALEENEFIAKVDSASQKQNALLNNAAIKDQKFVSNASKSLAYGTTISYMNYSGYHGFLIKDESFEATDAIAKRTAGIDYSNEQDFDNIPKYKQMVNTYFAMMMRKDGAEKTLAELAKIESDKIKGSIVPSFAYDVKAGNPDAEAIYNGILSVSTDSTLIARLTAKMEKIKLLAAGMPSPTFSYPNIDEQTVSLADLKGKYVYVDIWATWCGPCKREIPSLKQLESDFHDKNIAFVSISVDARKDYDKWQTMVAEKELSGYQLFADNSWQSDFVQAYAIEGIPRFILIDPAGNIINPDASRPSDPKTRAIFEKI